MVDFPVVVDSCVLYPMYLRDTLLCVAETGVYQPYWTEEILDETFRNLIKDNRIAPDKAQYLTEIMNRAFPEAMIEVTPKLIPYMDNHPGDRHVLATALIAKAEVILTNNLKHFPPTSLSQFRVEAKSADDFLTSLVDLFPQLMIDALQLQLQGKRKPKLTLSDLLALLGKQVPIFVSRCQDYYKE